VNRHCLVSTALLVGGISLALAAPAAADPAEDEFLRVIQQEGMTFTSAAGAAEDARYVCSLLADGMTGVQIGNRIISEAGFTAHQATVFVVEAAHAYCPEQMKQVLADRG
jgi:hypothetical protein